MVEGSSWWRISECHVDDVLFEEHEDFGAAVVVVSEFVLLDKVSLPWLTLQISQKSSM